MNDTVKIDLTNGKITDFIKFDTGTIAMVTGGRNMGRVGVITHRERHDGGFNIVHLKDAVDNEFATRESNVFVIGREKPWISLPKGKGVKVCTEISREPSKEVTNNCSSRLQRKEIVVGRMLWLGISCRRVFGKNCLLVHFYFFSVAVFATRGYIISLHSMAMAKSARHYL